MQLWRPWTPHETGHWKQTNKQTARHLFCLHQPSNISERTSLIPNNNLTYWRILFQSSARCIKSLLMSVIVFLVSTLFLPVFPPILREKDWRMFNFDSSIHQSNRDDFILIDSSAFWIESALGHYFLFFSFFLSLNVVFKEKYSSFIPISLVFFFFFFNFCVIFFSFFFMYFLKKGWNYCYVR